MTNPSHGVGEVKPVRGSNQTLESKQPVIGKCHIMKACCLHRNRAVAEISKGVISIIRPICPTVSIGSLLHAAILCLKPVLALTRNTDTFGDLSSYMISNHIVLSSSPIYRNVAHWQWKGLVANSDILRGTHSRSAGNTLEKLRNGDAQDYHLEGRIFPLKSALLLASSSLERPQPLRKS